MIRSGKPHVVIVGGSFGGLTTAFTLRQRMGPAVLDITVISRDDRFVFIPSLPWVAMGWRTLDRISFELEPALSRVGIRFMHAAAERIDPHARTVTAAGVDVKCDFLVIATGHRSANEAVPGLGPFDGPGHSLMSPAETLEAAAAWRELLERPGPIVVGCAPGASCIGPAYEFAFEASHALRRRRLRHRVPITFVTPEPWLGHFGVGGMGRSRAFLESEFAQHDIRCVTSAAVTRIDDASVELAGGERIESRFSLIIPPLAGVKAVAESPGLSNPKGFVPTDDGFRHKAFDNVFAVGVAVAYPPVDQTPVPVNFPKTGNMTMQMARTAAANIEAALTGGAAKSLEPSVRCLLDLGDRAAHLYADPVRPPRNEIRMSVGRRWLWAKRAYEPFLLWRMRRGKI